MPPRGHQIDKPPAPLVNIQPLDQLRSLGGDPPVTKPGLTASAQMASQRQQGGRADVAGVRSQRDGLDHVDGGTDAAAGDQGHMIAYPLLPQPLIHRGQRQLNGWTAAS